MSGRESLFAAVPRYVSRATGVLARTGVGRTTRKADTGAGFHPATRPNSPLPHGGLHAEETWLPIVRELRRGAPRIYGSAVVLAHIGRLIESGQSFDPENCPRCAQLVVSLREADGV